MNLCENYKNEFDKRLLLEVKKFVDENNHTLAGLIEEFKLIIKNINSGVRSYSCRDMIL